MSDTCSAVWPIGHARREDRVTPSRFGNSLVIRPLALIAMVALAVVILGVSSLAVPGSIILASTSDTNVKGNNISEAPSVSANGTRVAFTSLATNFDAGDVDDLYDVYVKDLATGDIVLASTSDAGVKGNEHSIGGSQTLSGDGKRVAFATGATNLDPADADGLTDIYVKDLATGDTMLASTSDAGVKANGGSRYPAISADGMKVAFVSSATNLDPADTDGWTDIYVKDLATGDIVLASTSDAGVKGDFHSGLYAPDLSADGSRVAFDSLANNLDPADSEHFYNWFDIYVKDLATGDIMLASTSDAGVLADGNNYEPTISGNGTRVGFYSVATNLDPPDTDTTFDVYVKDLTTGDIMLASASDAGVKGNSTSGLYGPDLSPNGARIAFASGSTNLDPGDTDSISDVYVKTLGTGNIYLASTSYSGVKGNQPSSDSSLSANGAIMAFASGARNMGPPDTDTAHDVYVKEVCIRTSRRQSIPCR